LALACDLIVASETAVFGLPEVCVGVMACAGGLFRLPRRIPYHRAMELALTGRRVTAQELERWGLLNRVVPEGRALDAAVEL
jgi:enoyl-CoA hydratase/carnithine racemase